MRTKNKQTNITTGTPILENITTPLLQKAVQNVAIGFYKKQTSFPIGPNSQRHFGLKDWESFA